MFSDSLNRRASLLFESILKATMTRKKFLKLAVMPTAMAALPSGLAMGAQEDETTFVRSNAAFRLDITVGKRLLVKITHLSSGVVLADGTYSYSIGTPNFTSAIRSDHGLVLTGDTGNGISVQQSISIDPKTNWIEEGIKLTNTNSHPVSLPFRCGLVLPVRPDSLKGYVFTAVPYRREPTGNRNQYADYTLDQVLYSRRRSRLRSIPDLNTDLPRKSQQQMFTDDFISEAWALTDGKQGFLIQV
jgi:hypothetical protein